MHPLKKGKVASQAHVGLPEGTFEESTGAKAFTVRARIFITLTRLRDGCGSRVSCGPIVSI
jgi:hypothetical protein